MLTVTLCRSEMIHHQYHMSRVRNTISEENGKWVCRFTETRDGAGTDKAEAAHKFARALQTSFRFDVRITQDALQDHTNTPRAPACHDPDRQKKKKAECRLTTVLIGLELMCHDCNAQISYCPPTPPHPTPTPVGTISRSHRASTDMQAAAQKYILRERWKREAVRLSRMGEKGRGGKSQMHPHLIRADSSVFI